MVRRLLSPALDIPPKGDSILSQSADKAIDLGCLIANRNYILNTAGSINRTIPYFGAIAATCRDSIIALAHFIPPTVSTHLIATVKRMLMDVSIECRLQNETESSIATFLQ